MTDENMTAQTMPNDNNQELQEQEEPETVSGERPEQEEESKSQVFEVVIPEGTPPNGYFTATAEGQRVLLQCPHNLVAGQRIRFKVPAVSSSFSPIKKVPSSIKIKIRVSPQKQKNEVTFPMRDRIITAGSSVLFMLVVLHCYSSSLSFHQCIC
eukprot:CAMPEP_0116133892 /NCGR_PEP_ID=MMETSP0329-20121206/10356_1 /TAXON_ID=697910 /ORGANISM="Pseudo-nitzschia arenysensis, Strain B593" /LENGTH=153 /DNA_ID=CAMNT_0003628569 /DNA_START=74 /DNA_END=535 /DNA_ORIENTATION=+